MLKVIQKTILVLIVILQFALAATAQNKKPVVVPYSNDEMHKFWNTHINKVVMEQLFGNKYPLLEIQQRFSGVRTRVALKYKKPLSIEASVMYSQDSPDVLAGAEITDIPIIRIFVPALIDKHRVDHLKDRDGEKKFGVLLATMIIHEMEHLLQNRMFSFMGAEADAWAKTCEHFLSIFVKNRYPLDVSGQHYFNAWVKCGRQNNKCWSDSIHQYYSRVDQASKK